MTAYIIRRLLLVIPTLIGIMTVNFIIVQIAPGGPVEQMIAQLQGEAVSATPAVDAVQAAEYTVASTRGRRPAEEDPICL